MPRLIWSRAALADISRLYAFLAPKNPSAAKRAIAAVRQGVRLLPQHPEAGKPIPEMPPEVREWPIGFGSGGYVALYRFDGVDVIVLSVRHGRKAGY